MALLFMDGFGHYATADITKKWNVAGSTVSVQATAGRQGGGALRNTSSFPAVSKTIPATTSFVIGFAVSVSSLSSTGALCALLDVSTVQCSLVMNADGTLSVVRGTATAVTSGTSTWSASINTYFYVEWKVTIADSISASSCKVRVNGADVITVAAGQDLKSTANTTASVIRLSTANGLGTATVDIDDVYFCDQSGSTNNDFLGDVRIDTLYPTSDGNYSQFTPSTGTTHYTLVDETSVNTTDYVDGATVGDRDSYGMGNLSAIASSTVYGVQVCAAMQKDDAGAKSASTFVRSGTTNSDGASAVLGTAQTFVCQVYEQDPAAAAAWTETTVNAMEAGVRVTA